MSWQRTVVPQWSLRGATIVLALAASAHAQSPDLTVRQLLNANPVLAPYNLTTAVRNGQVVLMGTVGTKQIHDIAVRMAINTGYPIRDDLVINTAAAHRVAAAQAQMLAAAGPGPGAGAGAGIGPSLGMSPGMGNLPYVYPPPLFGRIDNAFFGFEPPILSYPPWWRGAGMREPGVAPQPGMTGPAVGAISAGNTATVDPSTPMMLPLGPNSNDGVVEMTIDPRGAAFLRGTVPTLADRIAIGQKIAQTPGVTEVVNLLQVASKTTSENVPPPPQPFAVPAAPGLAPAPGAAPAQPDAGAPAGAAAIVVDGGALNDRLVQAFARRPALAGLPIKVTVRDGIATLSGKVPTVYEAMLAYRVVDQMPGMREVIDRMEFVVPDGEHQNPLIRQGRPEDVEPYLAAQIRRNVGDLAHVDRVRVLGDLVEIYGTLVHAEDRPRLDAILRSIAVLRGFRVEPRFEAE